MSTCPTILLMGLYFKGLFQTIPLLTSFSLTKPAAISAATRYYEGIEDALIVIEDVTAGIKDTLTLIVPQTGEYSGTYFYYYNYHKKKRR